MSKILITGGAGFIGSHLCDRLARDNHDIIVIDDLSSGKLDNLACSQNRITFINDSVSNLHLYAHELEGITRIYHLAALISGHDSLQQPDLYLTQNLSGLLRVIESARRNPGTRIIFASSSTVYGNRPSAYCNESDEPNPITVYALSKLAGEHLLSLYSHLSAFEYVCLRLFNVYGPRQNPDHPYANVTCKFSAAAACSEPICLYGDGEQSRDFVFIDDVVEAFVLASEQTLRRIYNVGTGRATSINNLIFHLQAISGKRFHVKGLPSWPNDIREIRANIHHLSTEFGFRPHVPIEEGLRRTVGWFESQMNVRKLEPTWS